MAPRNRASCAPCSSVLQNVDECMALRAAVGNSMTSALQQALH
jgi:hypothetical protein